MTSILVISLFNGIIFSLYCYLISFLLLQRKETEFKKIILSFIPFFIIYYCNLCLLDSIYSMFFSGLCAFYFIRTTFKENLFMSLFISVFINAVKIIIKIIILELINDPSQLLINTYKTLDWTAFYINLLAFVLSTLIIIIFIKKLRSLINYISGLNNRKLILLTTVYLNFILILLYQPPENFFCIRTATDFIIIFTVTGIGIFNISSERKMEILMKHYQEIFDYSTANGELLKHYKMQVHENKNRLLMIKGMLDGPKKETKKYIDSLLKEINSNKTNCYYWLSELRYIPLPGVRNFINYKLIQLTELNAEVEVFVSSELEKVDMSFISETEYNQITTVLGIILDNMIEAVKESEKKLVSINIYVENNLIHGEFANSFSGDIDLNRLYEVGYSTKGETHGVGLSLVEKITKANNKLECIPTVMDDFFIQHLTIKIIDKNSLLKKSKK